MLRKSELSRLQFPAVQEITVFQSLYKLEEGKSEREAQKWQLRYPPSLRGQLLRTAACVRLPSSCSDVPVMKESLKT